eukprot:9982678-Alexandrium_andersonii.AAC.1
MCGSPVVPTSTDEALSVAITHRCSMRLRRQQSDPLRVSKLRPVDAERMHAGTSYTATTS